MKRAIILILIWTMVIPLVRAQDPMFSQFFSSPLYLSPSLAGATDGTRIIANYRNQWPSIPKAYVNYAFSVDHYIKNYNSGIGLLVLQNQEGGAINTSNIGVNYSYFIKLNNYWRLNPGLKFSHFSRALNWDKLEFGDQINRNSNTSVEISRDENIHYYDVATSLLMYSENIWFGFTADHLLDLNKQFSTEPNYPALKISLYGGIKLMQKAPSFSSPDRSYTIAFLLKNHELSTQVDLGSYYERDALRFGLWFRGSKDYLSNTGLNAIVILTGFNYNQFKFNYSYDISTSRLMTLTGGAHELSMMYLIGWDSHAKKIKRKSIPCPEF